MGIIRGRINQDEWTRYENGKPVCGVGHRGFWTNTVVVGGPMPFQKREDGSWFDPKTGEDVVWKTLDELLAQEKREQDV